MTRQRADRVVIVAIGEELLSGDRLETNGCEMEGMLFKAGIRVRRLVVVGDHEKEIAAAVDEAAADGNPVITTGGLGPTEDDVTRQGVAAAAGAALKEDPEALSEIARFFTERNREMKPSNRRQALIPEGGERLKNPLGTAPGVVVHVKGVPVFCLPGVPSEMRYLMEHEVLPRVKELFSDRSADLVRSRVQLIGLTESSVNDQIKDLLAAQNPKAGITVHNSVITITLTARGAEGAEAVARAVQRLEETFGDRIFDSGKGITLEEAVGGLLIEGQITFALAESCTGGLVGHLFTQVPGISAVFLEGVVSYSGEAKMRTLAVPDALLAAHGEVSAEVAVAMARGVAERAGARAALGITGIAGPGGGTPEKPVGLVHMAALFDGAVAVKAYRFSGDRDQVKRRSAYLAMDLLRRTVLGLQ